MGKTNLNISPLIPFEEITKVASRDTIRAQKGVIVTGRQTWFIPIEMTRIREGWNPRTQTAGQSIEDWMKQEGIIELAESLLVTTDEIEPSRGDFSTDGKTFIHSDGERRFYARRWLLEQGYTHFANNRAINVIEVMENPKGMTETERLKQTHSTNRNKKLSPMQESKYVCKLKEALIKEGKKGTSEELAAEIGGVSRQWVDNYLTLAKIPQSDQEELEAGTLRITHALEKYRLAETKPIKMPFSNEPKTPEESRNPPAIQTSIINQLPEDEQVALNANDNTQPIGNTIDTDKEGEKAYDPFKPLKYDKMSIDDQEEEINTPPSGKYKEPGKPKNISGDALPDIDFRAEKTEAELNLNECVKMIDKMRVQHEPEKLPKSMAQWASDQIGFMVYIQKRINEAIQTIKKASDKR